jgi:hypothetical protein
MRRLSTFIFGMIAGGLVIYGALSYHLIHAKDGMHLIPKVKSTFTDTYVDIREFGPADWLERFEVAQALQAAGRADLIEAAAFDSLETGLDRLLSPPDDKR